MLLAVGAISSRISIRAGSKASASRTRFDCTPSIHIVSELRWKNGLSPSSASALTTPPPVPSTWSRSSEMITRGGELVQHVVEQRTAGHRHQRLRLVVRQRPHAQAEAGGKDHRSGGFDGH